MRPADDELARGVHVQDVVVADQGGQFVARALQPRFDARNEDRAHVLADALLHQPFGLLFAEAVAGCDELVVLGRDHDRVHAQRTAGPVVVFDRYLTFGVGPQIGHRGAFAADDGQLLEDHMREDERRGHVLAGFVAGIAEHDALIACALLLLGCAADASVDVGRLLVDGRQHAARVAVETVVALRVADAVDHAAHYALHVHIGIRAHFARHDHEARRAERLARDLGVAVAAQEFVEDRIRDLIRDFVGMAFRDRFRRKKKFSHFTFIERLNATGKGLAVGK